ncbi:hypothetical protein ACU4GR_01155 [Methylobacterium oryzae CBMB20]
MLYRALDRLHAEAACLDALPALFTGRNTEPVEIAGRIEPFPHEGERVVPC